MRFNSHSKYYRFLMHVCRIVYENLLPSKEPGEINFIDFSRDDRKMNRLFERFIFNFYLRELKRVYKGAREHIRWNFQPGDNTAGGHDYLPLMKTDITLSNDKRKIIMDAKFHQETTSHYHNTEKIKSSNLYQLFSYLINQEIENDPLTSRATGILIYPTTSKEFDLEYIFREHHIHIKTVNLNQDWGLIAERLKEIVE